MEVLSANPATDKSNPEKNDFQLELENGGSLSRRRTGFSTGGAYVFEDELKINGTLDSTIITCAAWLLEFFELTAGEVTFLHGEKTVRPNTNRFAVLYPPFTITKPRFESAKGFLKGIAAFETLPAKLPIVPTVFETARLESLIDAAQRMKILSASENFQSIEAYPKASLLSLKAKKLIDENYFDYPSISRVAERLNVSHAHLSRQFKIDFKISPSDYLRQLRVADAPLRLAKGEAIINVSEAVGYNDLSRFYKQFRRATNSSPGACRTIMKSNLA